MIRNLKALGLALVAVLALSAMSAASASAAEEFHSEVEPTVLTGEAESTQIFKASGVEIVCHKATFTGKVDKKTATSITVHPKYTECTSPANANGVTTDGCNYIFDSKTDANKDSQVKIECEGTHTITVHSDLCTLKFGTQTVGGGVRYDNIGSLDKREVTVTTTVKEITITEKTGPFCFAISGKGTYEGPSLVKGYKFVSEEGATTTGKKYVEGAQVGIWWE